MLFGKTQKETLVVEGMSCAHCERAVEAGLKGMAGVTRVKADHEKGRVEVSYKGRAPDRDALKQKVAELGYTVKA